MQSRRQAMRSSHHGPSSSSSSSPHHARTPSSSSASSTSSQRTATNVTASTSTIKLVPTTPSPRTPGSTHHSPGAQGYFEPTLMHPPSTQPQVPVQAPSQMAAAFAMASQRKRSATTPSPTSPPISSSALSAAGAALPREKESVPPTPGSDTSSPPMIGHAILHPPPPLLGSRQPTPPPATHSAPPTTKKESSKIKLFSKPGRIGTPQVDKTLRPPPSPNKIPSISSPIPRLTPSSAILASDRKPSLSAAIHSSASTAALISATQDVLHPFPSAASSLSGYSSSPPAKDHSHSHKPHFLRPRRDKDHANITFSSSASNSKAISADGSSLYSFGPSSPSSTVFGSSSKVDLQKSISGIDISSSSKSSKSFKSGASWEEAFLENSGLGTGVQLGENAWALLKNRVLGLFEGEPLKNTVEDLNRWVIFHIKRCHERRAALTLLEDVRDLLDAGMVTVDPTLVNYTDEKLIGRLVEIWGRFFGNILPYVEAVFLPLQQEFKGCGTIMTSRESREFFAEATSPGERLDVRRLALMSFRDNVILPLYSKLEVLFSTLQLDLSVSQSQITESVGKMLQCISVLSSVLTGDEAQMKIDALAKTLKHNWLSRGRTGRNRRGFVGTKALRVVV
ncbi:hypothetical protein RUND412_000853 [Rhizina undulata]